MTKTGYPSQRGAMPPGWYADPARRHQYRYADGHGWTTTVSDFGAVGVDPVLPSLPPTRPLYRRPWFIIALVAACLAVAGVFVGMQYIHSLDAYEQDFTSQQDDFGAGGNDEYSVWYRADGYHVRSTALQWLMSEVKAPSARTSLAARVTVRAVTAEDGTAFGVHMSAAHGPIGYGFSLSPGGRAMLFQTDSTGTIATISEGNAPALSAGVTRTIMLTCNISHGSVHLGGYVDGTRILTGTAFEAVPSIQFTGMTWQGADVLTPPEWLATRFERIGPDDLPSDAPR